MTLATSAESVELLDEHDLFFRSANLLTLGYVQQSLGDLDGALRLWRAAAAIEQRAGSHFVITALGDLAEHLERRGKRRAAAALCQDVLQQAEQHAHPPPDAAGFTIRLARLEYGANELVQSCRHAEIGIELSRRAGSAEWLVAAKRVLARIQQAIGQPGAALATIGEARELAALARAAPLARICAADEANLRLRQGDLAGAEQWAAAAESHPPGPHAPASEATCCTLARLRLAQGRPAEAQALLARLEYLARERGDAGDCLPLQVLQSLAHAAQGHAAAARACLARAIRLAAPEDQYRVFLDEGQAQAGLLPGLRHLAPGFVDRLLVDFGRAPSRPVGQLLARSVGEPLPAAEPSALIERLSLREKDILKLMADGLSYPEMAARLTISLNTVRFHVKNLYGKLAVHHRQEAIVRARELRLLA
jgi:LuxR family maltose regulon positive regulatory protein